MALKDGTRDDRTALELAISPAGRMHLEHVPGLSHLDPSAHARIESAYALSDSHGLLHLGAVELTTWLPPSLALGREIAQGFMARLCAVPDLAGQWDKVEVATPGPSWNGCWPRCRR